MPNNTTISNAVRGLAAQSFDQEFDNGYLRIYTGTQPASPDTAVTSQTLLAELRFASTAVASHSNGVLTFAPLVSEDSALANGNATWARCLAANGTTALMDLSVGTSDANLILPTTNIVAGVEIAISSMTVTVAQTSAQ